MLLIPAPRLSTPRSTPSDGAGAALFWTPPRAEPSRTGASLPFIQELAWRPADCRGQLGRPGRWQLLAQDREHPLTLGQPGIHLVAAPRHQQHALAALLVGI